jgi:choline dehydrogenase-like flavoprotein
MGVDVPEERRGRASVLGGAEGEDIDMATSSSSQRTDFTLDVTGRYVCNGLDEALASTDPSKQPNARSFDFIVIGGGSFGSVLATRLQRLDQTHAHRILVLEAGPYVLPEHVQNLPPGLDTGEVWGVPWNSDSPRNWNQRFPGLAFCVGGRSVFWGGWSPYLIDSELPTPPWPPNVKRDLTTPVVPTGGGRLASYLDHAADQIGTSATNDFVSGPLHQVLRDALFTGLKSRPGGTMRLTGNRGALNTIDDLEAPLAIQSTSPRPGFFPLNKFNAVQLLIRGSRIAQSEAEQTSPPEARPPQKDVLKRLMIVDNAHVIRLERQGRRITRVWAHSQTLPGPVPIDVTPNGNVFLALGTIENTRFALTTLPNSDGLIGRNLMAHLRSNLTIRIPRANFGTVLDPARNPELQVSALFVKGIFQRANGSPGHFHLQITASGVGQLETNSEAELFKKLPSIDDLDQFRGLTDEFIVLTLRGIGEMVGDRSSPDPQNRIRLDLQGPQGPFDFNQPRALVRLEAQPKDAQDPRGTNDVDLWNAMDQAAEEVALILANGGPIQYLGPEGWQSTVPTLDFRRDILSSTHHEGGTLWMGEDPATSANQNVWGVTDEWGRFHEADNLYAVGPALLPTLGSPNPMLSGVALSRRTADHLVPPPVIAAPGPQYKYLFDGTEKTWRRWRQAGGGAFALIDGALVAQPGNAIGLLFYAAEAFENFILRLEFLLPHPRGQGNDNSGVFVRFRNPQKRVPDRNNPNDTYLYGNTAFVAVDTGFEAQIDEEARGDTRFSEPDGFPYNRTGAIYKITSIGTNPGQQDYVNTQQLAVNTWHTYEIEISGQTYVVRLNGQPSTRFTNTDSYRGKPPSVDPASGYIGIQTHTGRVAFRNIQIRSLP